MTKIEFQKWITVRSVLLVKEKTPKPDHKIHKPDKFTNLEYFLVGKPKNFRNMASRSYSTGCLFVCLCVYVCMYACVCGWVFMCVFACLRIYVCSGYILLVCVVCARVCAYVRMFCGVCVCVCAHSILYLEVCPRVYICLMCVGHVYEWCIYVQLVLCTFPMC